MASLSINRLTTFPAYRSRFLSQDVVLSSPSPVVANRATTDVTVTATGLNSIYSVTIPANVMRATGRLHFDVFGTYKYDGSETLTFTIRLGGSTVFTLIPTLGTTVNDAALVLRLDLIAEAQTSSFGWGIIDNYTISTTGGYGTSTADLTTDLVFEVFAGWSAAAAGRTYTMRFTDALLYFPTDT